MLNIKNSLDMAAALASSIDPQLAQLLTLRRDQLLDYPDYELGELAHFVIAEPGDALAILEIALGFSVTNNLVDEARFGDPGFDPSWEFIARHGGWWELTYVLTDDGFGHVLLVPDLDGVDSTLLALCRTYGHQAA